MRIHYSYLLIFFLFLSACNDAHSVMDETLLGPNVKVAQEFVDHLKKNERFYVLTLVDGYDPDALTSNNKIATDKEYSCIQAYTDKYKLKPLNKWFVTFDTLRAKTSDFTICFQNIFIPFDAGMKGDDPAFLRLGFYSDKKTEMIADFQVVLRKDCSADEQYMNLSHELSYKQKEQLAQ